MVSNTTTFFGKNQLSYILQDLLLFMNGKSCDKCLMGYKPQDVDQCPKCNWDFCDGCMHKHDCK